MEIGFISVVNGIVTNSTVEAIELVFSPWK